MKPLISICIPNYNYAKFIEETIESVLSQTYGNFEILIAENASTDNSLEVISRYKDPRIKILRNEVNVPLYQNISKCVSHAAGEIITILHSDDFYEPEFLAEVVKAYSQYSDKKVFVTAVENFHDKQNAKLNFFPFNLPGVRSSREVLTRLACFNNIGNGVNVAFHRDILNSNQLFAQDYRFSADYELWFRLAKHYDFVYIPKVLAHYRIHTSNLSHVASKNADMFREGIVIAQKYLNNPEYFNNIYKEKLLELNKKFQILKAFYLGGKYSGATTRKMLDVVDDFYPGITSDFYWSAVRTQSYFVDTPFHFIAQLAAKSFICKLRISLKKELEAIVNRASSGFTPSIGEKKSIRM